MTPQVADRDDARCDTFWQALRHDSYDWEFVPIPGYTFTDAGSVDFGNRRVTRLALPLAHAIFLDQGPTSGRLTSLVERR